MALRVRILAPAGAKMPASPATLEPELASLDLPQSCGTRLANHGVTRSIMKLSVSIYIIALSVPLFACGSHPAPTAKVASSEAAVRAADELKANDLCDLNF